MSSVPRATRIGPSNNGHAQTERTPGSVRKAREMIEERQRLEDKVFVPSPTSLTHPPLPSPHADSIPIEPPRPVVIEPLRSRPSMPAPINSKVNLGAIGAAISRPSPMAQWPLKEENEADDAGQAEGTLRRPTIVTSPPEQSRPQDQYPPFPYRPPKSGSARSPPKPSGYWEDDYQGSQNPNRKTTNSAYLQSASSRTSSSLGSIPDFPIPDIPAVPAIPGNRRTSNNGPPNSRRGVPSSHYSTGSNVLPIPEETYDGRYHQSFASSKVMPSSWGSANVMDHYFVEDAVSGDSDNNEEGGAASPDHEERGLVQQASISKRQRPSITSIESGKRKSGSDGDDPPVVRMGVVPKGVVSNSAAPAAGAAGTSVAAAWGSSKNSSQNATIHTTSGGTTAIATPSMAKTPPTGLETDALSSITENASGSARRPRADQANAILAGIKQAGSPEVQGAGAAGAAGGGGGGGQGPRFSDSRGLYSDNHQSFRRPARLNLENQTPREVRDSRGSLTSLPDLIRRATRLATTLDRGGRPASRWDPMLYTVDEKPRNGHGHNDSFSGMIASFPPPGQTPTTDRFPSPNPGRQSRWPGPYGEIKSLEPLTDASSDGSSINRRRYCCGIPLLVFVLLVIIGVLLIAAAVVIPITLIVIPRKHHSHTISAASGDQCETKMPCQNGGASIMTDSCHCICVNGYSGTTCGVVADSSCVTTKIDSKYPNATIGSGIPRLFTVATSNFSVPLNSSALFSAFSQANSSCSYENSLVTFNGTVDGMKKRRSVPVEDGLSPVAVLLDRAPDTTLIPTPNAPVARAMDVAAVTSNGIVFANPTATSVLAVAATQSSQPLTFPIDQTAYDFARVSVLYIIQETNIGTAVEAQGKMQSFFATSTMSDKVDVGNNITVDFNSLSLDIHNTTIGGTPGRGPS